MLQGLGSLHYIWTQVHASNWEDVILSFAPTETTAATWVRSNKLHGKGFVWYEQMATILLKNMLAPYKSQNKHNNKLDDLHTKHPSSIIIPDSHPASAMALQFFLHSSRCFSTWSCFHWKLMYQISERPVNFVGIAPGKKKTSSRIISTFWSFLLGRFDMFDVFFIRVSRYPYSLTAFLGDTSIQISSNYSIPS